MEVSLGALSRNFAKIKALAPSARILPMVKGDAYGHGIVPVSKHLVDVCGVTRLGVASLHEAVTIINGIPSFAADSKFEVVVFSDTEIHSAACRSFIYNRSGPSHLALPESSIAGEADVVALTDICNANIIPVIGTAEDLSLFLGLIKPKNAATTCTECFNRLPLFIKVNTGMNRMGLTPEVLKTFIPAIKERRGGKIDLLLQHFSSSWIQQTANDTTTKQYARFKEIQQFLENDGVSVKETSVSNSGAIEQGVGVEETWVRPGLMLYGAPSVVGESSTITDLQVKERYTPIYNGEVVGSFQTKIINVYPITQADLDSSEPKGTMNVGYGFNAVRGPCVIALLPIGYADGFLRYNTGLRISVDCGSSGSRKKVLVGEVHGFVNMDITQLAFYPDDDADESTTSGASSIDEIVSLLHQEQKVVVWGHDDNRDIHAKATFLKTNAYQLLTAVSVRIPRKYVAE